MNKLIVATFLFVLTFQASAQDKGFYYGTRFSLGETSFETNGLQNEKGKLMWQVGAASAYQITEHIGLTADFLLTGGGTKNTGVHKSATVLGNQDRPYAEKFNLISGDVPVLLKASFGFDKLYLKVYGGPSVNFQFAALHSITYDDANYNKDNGFENNDVSNNFETMNIGIVYGAGVDVKAGDGRIFFLDFRMGNSNKAIGMFYNEDIKSSYMGLSAGYLFH